MTVHLIQVPYDSSHRDLRMGRGPTWFIQRGAVQRIEKTGRPVCHSIVESASRFPMEIAMAFELCRHISEAVARARSQRALPLVLAGNCNSSIGTVAGLHGSDVGVVWFDAHADCETPETTTSGYLDGMALATLTGRCWAGQRAKVPGFRPVATTSVVLVGPRQVSEPERRFIQESGITFLSVESLRQAGPQKALLPAMERLRQRGVGQIYLHIDMDVHDPEAVAPANTYAEPGGLTAEEVRGAVEFLSRHTPIAAAALTSYDPDLDRENRLLETGFTLMDLLASVETVTG